LVTTEVVEVEEEEEEKEERGGATGKEGGFKVTFCCQGGL
jgi:hypothetical protein